MNKKHIILLALMIFLLHIGIKFPFRSKMFAGWDGPQFAIAMNQYSVKDYFPAPPGHFLYVMAAKFVDCFLNDPFSSLLSLNVIFSGLLCAALFLVGMKIFSFKTGLISSLIYISSPLFWYYSTTLTVHPISGFFAFISGFFLFEAICRKREKSFIWASLSYGLMIGIRPQDFIFILPFWAFAMFKVKIRFKILSSLALISVCLAWFIPFSIMSGGAKELISFLLKEIFSGSTRLSSSIFNIPGLIKANLKYQIFVYLITFGIGAIPFFYYLPQFFNIKSIILDKRTQVFLIWIIPSLIFWSICNFATPGYIIVSLLPMIILLAEFLSRMADEITESLVSKAGYIKNKNVILIPFIIILIITNTVIYFYDPHPQDKGVVSDSFRRYHDNKKMDIQLTEKFKYIRENIPSESSVIITSSSFFMQAMYYLYKYHVYLYNGPTRQGNIHVFYGNNFQRHNRHYFDMLNFLSENRIERVVFFDDTFKKRLNTLGRKETIPIADGHCLTVAYPDKDDKLTHSYRGMQIDSDESSE